TSQPGIGCAAVCIKFGWEDFQTAWWLRRTDHNRSRGNACFWLYGALGLWKAALVALVMSVALAIVLPSPPQNFPQQPAPVPATFFMCLGTFWTTLADLLLSGFATIWAIWLGWRFRIKFWVNGAVQFSRRQNVWPPVGELAGRFNYLGLLMVNALIFFVFLLVGLIAGSAAYFKDQLGPGKEVWLVPIVLGL